MFSDFGFHDVEEPIHSKFLNQPMYQYQVWLYQLLPPGTAIEILN
jgi:hypothetical protein